MANSRELAQFASFVNFTGSSIGLTTQVDITGISTFNNAVICGTPIPATILVVQIEPGPIPTFNISAPEL